MPGPLFTFAAYLGAAEGPTPHGWIGGLVALAGIYVPSFLLVWGVLPFWDRVRTVSLFQAALRGMGAAVVGILFGIPSLRIKGLYLAVATLAAQFFFDWLFARVKWFTNYTSSGSVNAPELNFFGWIVHSPIDRYLLCLIFVVTFAAIAKNFAGLLPLWDILFGTYYMPRGRFPENFGIHEPMPRGYLGQLWHPIAAWRANKKKVDPC